MSTIQVRSETQQIIVDPATSVVSIVNAGPPGPRGTGTGYTHDQASASAVWTINHNLGYNPTIQTFSVGGVEILGEVQHISSNQTLVTFNIPLSGTARLS